MEYSSYENYTKAGNMWIDKYPNTWSFRKLKFTASIINEKVEAKESTLEYMGLEHIESWTGKKLAGGQAESDGVGSVFQEDDVLFGKLRPYLAKVYKAEVPGLATSEALVLRPDELTHPDFLKYYLLTPSFIDVVNGSTYGAKMPRASWDFIGELPVLLPSVEEQQKIAAFLDYKTQQIDQLIAKKKALIEKLEEKRIAVITQAVTKGLDKHVTLKPSGVDWLGDVPEHWEISRVDFVATVKARLGWKALTASEYVDDGYVFLATPNIKGENQIDFEKVNYITEFRYLESPEIMLKEGDVLLAKDGSTLGITNLVRKLPRPATVNSSIAVIRLIDKTECKSEYLFRWFTSNGMQRLIDRFKDGQGVPHLFQADIKKFPILLPPIEEQKTIINFLNLELTKLTDQLKKVEKAMDLLVEYRSSLITSAVTGKIDVRNVQIPKEVA